MEGKGPDGAATPPMEQRIGDVQRQELLATALREDNTPATAICIYYDTEKNVDGRLDTFYHQALQSLEGAAGSSARGYSRLSL